MTHRNIRTRFAVAASAIASAFLLTLSMGSTTANAQCAECPTVGQIICCPGSSLADFTRLGYSITVTATTNGCFRVTSCTPPPPASPCPWQADLELQSFTGTAIDPIFGNVHWANDPTKTSSLATFRGLAVATLFPAEGTISFYAQATIDCIPGVYRSQTQVVIHNRQVMSFNPFVNETFTRDANEPPILFVNDVTGDVLTLTNLSSTLN